MPRGPLLRVLAVAVVVVVILSLGPLAGYRWNPAHQVAAPADDAPAARVALAYVEAFNQRDFRLAQEL